MILKMSTAAPAKTEQKLITGEELFAMGDIGPCELIDGRIVPVSPTNFWHGAIESRFDRSLGAFVEPGRLGTVVVGEVGIFIRRNPDRVRAADVAFVSAQRLAGNLPKAYLEVAPELVIEIISPTDRWEDMRAKIADYFSIGVARVWIVEPNTRSVLVYRSETEMRKLTESDTLSGEGVLEGFSLKVSDLFEGLPGQGGD